MIINGLYLTKTRADLLHAVHAGQVDRRSDHVTYCAGRRAVAGIAELEAAGLVQLGEPVESLTPPWEWTRWTLTPAGVTALAGLSRQAAP